MVNGLPNFCSSCLDKIEANGWNQPAVSWRPYITGEAELAPIEGEKAEYWEQSLNKFFFWLSRIPWQNFKCWEITQDIACYLKRKRKWQQLYIKPGKRCSLSPIDLFIQFLKYKYGFMNIYFMSFNPILLLEVFWFCPLGCFLCMSLYFPCPSLSTCRFSQGSSFSSLKNGV